MCLQLLMGKKLREKLDHVKKAVEAGKYRFTLHGAQQLIARRLKRVGIEEAVKSGEIIEDYPKHHYGPACLILGKTVQGKSLHLVCSLQEIVDIITVYEPDLIEWENNLKTRKK